MLKVRQVHLNHVVTTLLHLAKTKSTSSEDMEEWDSQPKPSMTSMYQIVIPLNGLSQRLQEHPQNPGEAIRLH